MNLRRMTLTVAALFCLLLSRGSAQTALHEDLEKAYNDAQSAVSSKQVEKIQQTWSTYAFRVARNSTVSAKKEFPAYFIETIGGYFPPSALDLKKLKRVKTSRRGDTASIIYYGKLFEETDSSLTAFHFAQEAGQWKFDRIASIGINKEQARKLLAGQDTTLLQDKDLQPSGVVRPLPPEYPEPAYVGHLSVVSWGYKTTVSYNGESDSYQGGSGGGMMLGGLRRGKNVIVIKAQPLPRKPGDKLIPKVQVTVSASPLLEGFSGVDTIFRVKVFSFKSETLSGEVTKEFAVTDEILSEGLRRAKERDFEPEWED